MKIIEKFMKFIALMLYLILAVIPLYWIIITSLKDIKEVFVFPIKYLPQSISFESYRKLFVFTNFTIYFRNSLMVSLPSFLIEYIIIARTIKTISLPNWFKTERIKHLTLLYVCSIHFHFSG